MKKDKNIKNIKKNYRKNMSDEQKQRYRKAKDKYDKYKEYQKNYRKNMSDEQKQRYREARNKKSII